MPTWAVLVTIVLIGLAVMGLLGATIVLMFVQVLRSPGGLQTTLVLVGGAFIVLVLAYPSVYLLALLMITTDEWIDDPCPSCRRKELEWTSERFKDGKPAPYRYLRCRFCGAKFRRSFGGDHGPSVLESVESTGLVANGSTHGANRAYPEAPTSNGASNA